MGGELIAERGVKGGDMGIAFIGMVVLQLAFGIFGAGIISFAPADARVTILGITAVVTAIVTAIITGYVYARSSTFEHWGRFANFAFLGGVVVIAIGTFVLPVLLLVGFVFIFSAFCSDSDTRSGRSEINVTRRPHSRRSASTSPSPVSSSTSSSS